MADEELPRFARVPAGEFTMGAEDGHDDERPTRTVFVEAFHLAVNPVTNDQYAAFVRDTGHAAPTLRELPRVVTTTHEASFRELSAGHAWHGGEVPRDRGRHPVTLVGYADATAYCRWLTERTGRQVRLPTETEWERAARGGVEQQRYPWGDTIDPSRANYLADPSVKRHRGTRPVGSFPATGFGLVDMVGNVWEWVFDWYRADAYEHAERHGARGPTAGRLRLLRGGSWVTSDPGQLRCAHRHKVPPDTYAYSIGFRVASNDQLAS